MSQFISLAEAAQMTALYRQHNETILGDAYKQQNILAFSESFDREQFDTLLSKEGCTGLRIYYGMDSNYKVHAIIVGINENGEDMITSSLNLTTNEEDDEIIERGTRCPDICPPASELNTDQP